MIALGLPAKRGATARSFVVQFADLPRSHRFRGRVEHVGTGDSRRFHSRRELLRFLASVLEDPGHTGDDPIPSAS